MRRFPKSQQNSYLVPRMKAAVAYQGSKQQIASKIVNLLPLLALNQQGSRFYDLCCGTGSISMELVDAQLVKPYSITMVDIGPWGVFWELIGKGEFDIARLHHWCLRVPDDEGTHQQWLYKLRSKVFTREELVYPFLLMQAGSYGGRPVVMYERKHGYQLASYGFRKSWKSLVQETSGGAECRTMRPGQWKIYERVLLIAQRMKGVTGYCSNAENFHPGTGGLIYIDPNYPGLPLLYGRGNRFNVTNYVRQQSHVNAANTVLCVSYSEPLPDAHSKCLHVTPSMKSRCRSVGIRDEWFNCFQWKEVRERLYQGQ